MFKIAGHTMGTPNLSVVQAINLFGEIGLDGVEIIVQDGYKCAIPCQTSYNLLDGINAAADKANIQIICLTPYYSKFNSLDDNERNYAINGLKKVIEYAAYLGAQYIRIYGGEFFPGESDKNGIKRKSLIKAMHELGDIANDSNVCLVIENHFNTMAVSAESTTQLLNDINHPAVGALYDQANLTFTGNEEYEVAIEYQRKYIRYVHVKDMVFKDYNMTFSAFDISHPKENERNVISKVVGEGIVPWNKILLHLYEIGFEGWLSLEYEKRWFYDQLPEADIGMKNGAEYLRKILFQNLK